MEEMRGPVLIIYDILKDAYKPVLGQSQNTDRIRRLAEEIVNSLEEYYRDNEDWMGTGGDV